jgi:hypothetical protein
MEMVGLPLEPINAEGVASLSQFFANMVGSSKC